MIASFRGEALGSAHSAARSLEPGIQRSFKLGIPGSRKSASRNDGALHPFTAPAVRPWIKWRCRKLNSTATGTVLRITPAESGPHCTSYWPTM